MASRRGGSGLRAWIDLISPATDIWGVEAALHRALRLEFTSWASDSFDRRNEHHRIGHLFGHTLLLHRWGAGGAAIELGHGGRFRDPWGPGSRAPIPDDVPGLDISAAITTLLHDLLADHGTEVAFSQPDGPLQHPDQQAETYAQMTRLGVRLQFRTPASDLESSALDSGSREVRGEEPPYPLLDVPPPLEGIHRVVREVSTAWGLWLTPSEALDDSPTFACQHMGMNIQLVLGTVDHPVHEIVGVPNEVRPNDRILDASPYLLPALWCAGRGRWHVWAPRSDGSLAAELGPAPQRRPPPSAARLPPPVPGDSLLHEHVDLVPVVWLAPELHAAMPLPWHPTRELDGALLYRITDLVHEATLRALCVQELSTWGAHPELGIDVAQLEAWSLAMEGGIAVVCGTEIVTVPGREEFDGASWVRVLRERPAEWTEFAWHRASLSARRSGADPSVEIRLAPTGSRDPVQMVRLTRDEVVQGAASIEAQMRAFAARLERALPPEVPERLRGFVAEALAGVRALPDSV